MKEYVNYNNHQLVELFSKDDVQAFTEVYNRFWKKLLFIAYSRLKDNVAAEDILHDVFTSLWANRHKIQIDSLENYLATATKFSVLTRLKKQSREQQYTKSLHQPQVIEMSVETSLHYKHLLEIVNNEVERLPEKCKLIFKFSRNQGMSVREISEELKLSPRTVENQINRAIKQLRLATKSLYTLFLL